MRRIRSLKNLIWAVSILLCLGLMLVMLFTAAFTHYSGPKERGGVLLGAEDTSKEKKSKAKKQDADAADAAEAEGDLLRLAETGDGGQAYLDSLTFLVDSRLIGLRNGLLSGGNETTQVWASPTGSLPAAELGACIIRYPQDGSQISPGTAAMVAKPQRLVICLGSDGLAQVDQEGFQQALGSLLRDIRSNSPDTQLILCSLPAATPGYAGSDGFSSALAAVANGWIQNLCRETGAYYADIGSLLRDGNGNLLEDYAESDGKTLNSAGLGQVLLYLRGHTV